MNTSERKAVLGVALLYIFRMLGLFMVLPVIALHTGRLEGATPLLIGLALGIYGLSQAALQIPFGLLSDRLGRKPVIFAGLLLFIAGSVVAAQAESIQGIIAGRCLQGAGAIASTMMALLSDLTRIEQRTKAMAGIGISIGLSFAFALALGPAINSLYGLSGIFWVTAALGVVGIGILVVLIPSPVSIGLNRDSQLVTGEVNHVLKNGQLLRIDLGIFLLHYTLMSSFVMFPFLLIGTESVAERDHSLVYLSVLMISFVFAAPLMRLSDKRHLSRAVLSGAIVLFLMAHLVLAFDVAEFWWVWSGMLLFFMAFNLLEIAYPSLLSKLTPAGTRGTAMGVYSTCQFLGAFCGGAVGGWILQMWDMSTLLLVNAVVAILWLISTITMARPRALSSRTIYLGESGSVSAIQIREALSSVAGIEEVVIIEGEDIAYLKVDDDRFVDDSIDDLMGAQRLANRN